MDISKMKNIVILKNLPSNLVDEAIVILKQNKKIKKPEFIESKKNKFSANKESGQGEENDFIIKEAENIISDYISKIENEDLKIKNKYKKMKLRYNKIKALSILLGILCLFFIII